MQKLKAAGFNGGHRRFITRRHRGTLWEKRGRTCTAIDTGLTSKRLKPPFSRERKGSPCRRSLRKAGKRWICRCRSCSWPLSRSSTAQLDIPWIWASWITAVRAFSAVRHGSRNLARSLPVPNFGIRSSTAPALCVHLPVVAPGRRETSRVHPEKMKSIGEISAGRRSNFRGFSTRRGGTRAAAGAST